MNVAIKRLLDLPAAKTASAGGWEPDPAPRFGPILAQRWHDDAVPLARAHPDARFRHSDAGGCARAIAYAALDVPASNPMDLAGTWVTKLGHMIHEAWQDELEEVYGPDAEIEVKVHEGERAGHVDAVVSIPGQPTELVGSHQGEPVHLLSDPRIISIEGKSVGGYKYQLAVGARGKPEGPSYGNVLQAALNAKALNADEAVIIYWDRDVISHQMAARKPHLTFYTRFTAEWTLTREQYEPLATSEIERIEGILALVDSGTLPARRIPDPELPSRALIVAPSTATWAEYNAEGAAVNGGTTWQCHYCKWQRLCSKTLPGRIPVADLPTEET